MAEDAMAVDEKRTPQTVREILTEMKDTSEVMVDLAYAALQFDSEEIAEEVELLEKQMDALMVAIRTKAMMSARTRRDAEQLSGLLQVASAADAISNAAADMVELLKYESDKRPFLSHVLKEAEEKILSVTLSERSDMANKSLEELSVESETGMRIIAIRRGKRWIYDPPEDTRLKGGDFLVVRGTEGGFETLKRFAAGEMPWPVHEEEEGESEA